MNPSLIQTFYVSSDSLGGSTDFLLSSIDLFFRSKPSTTKNTSGSIAPGVSIFICEVVNDAPVIENSLSELVRKPYDNIYAFADASVSTKFAFGDPIPLKADRFYGICVALEDDQYLLWKNIQEQYLIGTNNRSTGSTTLSNGRFYEAADNYSSLKYLSDTNITFKVNVAKFSSNNFTYVLANEDYEFLSVTGQTGSFKPGEQIWKVSANAAGTVAVANAAKSIIGTGTSFTSLLRDSFIAITDGTKSQVMQIAYIANNTYMESYEDSIFTVSPASWYSTCVGNVFDYRPLENKLYLTGSTANSTLKFANSDSISGEISQANAVISRIENLPVDNMNMSLTVIGTNSSNVAAYVSVATANSSNVFSSSNSTYYPIPNGRVFTPNATGYILSRSVEVDQPFLLNGKSINFKLDCNTKDQEDKLFFFPVVDLSITNVFVGRTKIVSSTANNTVDTEVFNDGVSPNKYISKKVSFANNRYAEDIKVFLDAFRPSGSNIQVYAKLHNSKDPESFEDKLWTPLVITDNKDRYSSSNTDIIEYSYGLANNPELNPTLVGQFTTNGTTTIAASGIDPSVTLAAGDMVKIFNPVFPANFSMHRVTSANSTAFVVDIPPSVTASGLSVAEAKYPRAAFTNINNNYVMRYYTETGAYIDTFDAMQVKIVITSANSSVTPEIDSLKVIGVSA